MQLEAPPHSVDSCVDCTHTIMYTCTVHVYIDDMILPRAVKFLQGHRQCSHPPGKQQTGRRRRGRVSGHSADPKQMWLASSLSHPLRSQTGGVWPVSSRRQRDTIQNTHTILGYVQVHVHACIMPVENYSLHMCTCTCICMVAEGWEHGNAKQLVGDA